MDSESKKDFPFEYREVGLEETEEIKSYFVRECLTKFIRVGSAGYFYYKEFTKTLLDVYSMPLRRSDVFVMSFPRSGTTWTQELVWLLQNNLDFQTAKSTPLSTRFPFLEAAAFSEVKFNNEMSHFKKDLCRIDPDMIKGLPSPRYIKTHMPLSLLPQSLLDTAKIVYVARDPRDVAVSNYFQLKNMHFIPQEADFKEFWNFFMENKIRFAPYFEHLKEAWNQRNHPNMFFIFYEELIKDLQGAVRRLAEFFGQNYTDEQYSQLCAHLSFNNFKNTEIVFLPLTNFVRKGKAGGWRQHFDQDMALKAERWLAENLRDSDLCFPDTE